MSMRTPKGRKLYVPRMGPSKRISIFDLDSLQPAGEIPDVGAHGVAVDPKSHHGFASSKPVAMWDTNTMKTIKTIDVQGNPDGIFFDSYKSRVYVLSLCGSWNVTVIDAADGSVVGTIDLGGTPEQGRVTAKRPSLHRRGRQRQYRRGGRQNDAGDGAL